MEKGNIAIPASSDVKRDHAAMEFADRKLGLKPFSGSAYGMVLAAFRAGAEWQVVSNTWLSVENDGLPPYGEVVAATYFELGRRGPVWLSYRSENANYARDSNDFVVFRNQYEVTHYMRFPPAGIRKKENITNYKYG